MAISVDWVTGVITVPQADLTFVSGTQYTLDINAFRLELKDLEASQEGIPYTDTHSQRAQVVTLGTTTYRRIIEILPPYTVTFEDGQYAVDLIGENSNIKDRTNRNQVSVGSNNSAGLVGGESLTRGRLKFTATDAKQTDGIRIYVVGVAANGAPATGITSGDFTATVVAPDLSTTTSPTVSETSGKAGLYTFLVPSSFLTTNGSGKYAIVIQANSSAPALTDTTSASVHVSIQDIDGTYNIAALGAV